jgi:hypothetical protein
VLNVQKLLFFACAAVILMFVVETDSFTEKFLEVKAVFVVHVAAKKLKCYFPVDENVKT